MNFEELKKNWNEAQDLGNDPIILKKNMQTAHNAIDKVRQNMKIDFWGLLMLGVISIVGLYYLNFVLDLHSIIVFTINTFFFLISILVLFFFIKFYKFYKKSYHLNYDSRDNLMWFYYELRSFIDFYQTCFFVFFIMGIACGLSIGLMTANLEQMTGQQDPIGKMLSAGLTNQLIYFGSQAIIIVGGTILFKWLINKMYSRYLKQIKTTLDYLKEEI